MTTTATYADAVHDIAADVIAQLIDGQAPHRDYNAQLADGSYRPTVRVYFADLPQNWHPTIPGGAVRVALDIDPIHARRPAHEARVFFEGHDYATEKTAADIAAAVLNMIDSTADYAR